MTDIARLFDPYNRQARLYPALLVLLPAVVMFLAWLPTAIDAGKTIVGIAAACGLLFLFADYARTRGKRLEPSLLKEWGGWPTTIWLRHSDDHLTGDVKQRYHAYLSKQSGIGPFPTATEERADPVAADQQYVGAVMWLKEQCRGAKFPLVEKENATYGFRRNLLGLRPLGVAVGVIVLLLPAAIALIKVQFRLNEAFRGLLNQYTATSGAVLGAEGFSVLAIIALVIIVRRQWVREAGDQYARALLACCDTLPAHPK